MGFQSVIAHEYNQYTAYIDMTLTAAVTAGQTLLVSCCYLGAAPPTTVTDTKGNTWVLDVSVQTSGETGCAVFRCQSSAAMTTADSISINGNKCYEALATSWDTFLSSPVDKTAVSYTLACGPTGTTTFEPEIAIAVAGYTQTNGPVTSPSAGWTVVPGSYSMLNTAYQTLSVDEAVSCTWGGSPNYVNTLIVTYKQIPPAPTDTTAPIASGNAWVGQTLSSTTGSWTNSPTSYAYQWNRNGVAITGATASTYTLQSADTGDSITCSVTASNAGGASTPTSSNAIGPIAGSRLQIGRLTLGTPLQFYEQMGDPITNLGGAIVPSPRTALRHAVTVPTIAGDGLTDTLAARLQIRDQLRSILNNSSMKLQGYCYVQYSDDIEQNGWYIPDQGQLSDLDGASGLATGAWKLDNVNWAMVGHRRTHREARNIWMKYLPSGLNYRDTLRLFYSTDFAGLANNGSAGALGITILPAGAAQAIDTVTGQIVPLTTQIGGRDGSNANLTIGPSGYSPLPDLSCVAYERAESYWGLSDVVCYDRRGDLSAPAAGPASDWVEVYGADYPWNWVTNGGASDIPILDNGLVRVRYGTTGSSSIGFTVDYWNGTAYVEQGTLVVQRIGDSTSYDNTFVAAGLHLDNSYTPDSSTASITIASSTDAYSRERVFITVTRGNPSVTFECYPAPKAAGGNADVAFWWQTAVQDTNDSVCKVDNQTQTSATIGPSAGNGVIVASAGTGSSNFPGVSNTEVGASSFNNSENGVALLRCSAVATLNGYQTNFATLIGANSYCATGHGAVAYTTNGNIVILGSQNGCGYLNLQVGFSPAATQQVMEAESMTVSGGTVTTDSSASNNSMVKFTGAGTLSASNWPNGQPGVYRVFARCKATSTGSTPVGTIQATTSGSGGTSGAQAHITEQTTPVYAWYDLGEVSVPNATTNLTLSVSTSSGYVDVDRIESFLMTERISPSRYTGVRDFGQAALYDSRALGAVVSR